MLPHNAYYVVQGFSVHDVYLDFCTGKEAHEKNIFLSDQNYPLYRTISVCDALPIHAANTGSLLSHYNFHGTAGQTGALSAAD